MNIELYSKRSHTRECLTNYFSEFIQKEIDSGLHYVIINKLIYITKNHLKL